MIPALLSALLGLAAGCLLGVLYFAGLWLTVRALGRQRPDPLAMAAGFIARLALVAGALLLLGRISWIALLAAAPGFLLARVLVVRHVLRPNSAERTPFAPGAQTGGSARSVPRTTSARSATQDKERQPWT